MGVPLVIIHFSKVFPYKPSIIGYPPIFRTPPCSKFRWPGWSLWVFPWNKWSVHHQGDDDLTVVSSVEMGWMGLQRAETEKPLWSLHRNSTDSGETMEFQHSSHHFPAKMASAQPCPNPSKSQTLKRQKEKRRFWNLNKGRVNGMRRW